MTMIVDAVVVAATGHVLAAAAPGTVQVKPEGLALPGRFFPTGLGVEVLKLVSPVPPDEVQPMAYVVEGLVLVPAPSGPGAPLPPPPEPVPVPERVTRTQLRLSMLDEPGQPGETEGDTLLDWVDRFVALSADRVLQERWAAGTMERASPMLAAMAPVFGLTDIDVDRIFIRAAGH